MQDSDGGDEMGVDGEEDIGEDVEDVDEGQSDVDDNNDVSFTVRTIWVE